MSNKKNRNAMYSLIIAAVLLLTAGEVFAREGRTRCGGPCGTGYGPDMQGFHHLDFLQKELGLADQQVKEIFNITQKYREKYFENRDNVDRTLELRVEERKEIKKILNDDQKKKFDELYLRRGKNRDCPYRDR